MTLIEAAGVTGDRWRAGLVEQAMRVTGRDELVDLLARSPIPSPSWTTALGRLLNDSPAPLLPGTPLASMVLGGPVRDDWRDLVPVFSGSCWARWQDLRALHGCHSHVVDPWQDYLDLQHAWTAATG